MNQPNAASTHHACQESCNPEHALKLLQYFMAGKQKQDKATSKNVYQFLSNALIGSKNPEW